MQSQDLALFWHYFDDYLEAYMAEVLKEKEERVRPKEEKENLEENLTEGGYHVRAPVNGRKTWPC